LPGAVQAQKVTSAKQAGESPKGINLDFGADAGGGDELDKEFERF